MPEDEHYLRFPGRRENSEQIKYCYEYADREE